MNIKSIVRAGAVLTLLIAGSAAAQVFPGGVTVTTNPVTSVVTPGSGVNLGTIAVVGTPTGASISSIPITITPGGGAAVSNLSNCQVFNSATGASLNTGNAVNVIGSGANAFALNAPLSIGSATTTLAVRCDVASNTTSGATFRIAAGAPGLTTALNVNLDTAPSVPAGSQDVALANILLSGVNSGANVNVASIPLSISAGGGAAVANLTDCRVRDTQNLDGWLNANVPVIGAGATTYTFATPFTVFAGSSRMLAFTCDIAAGTPVGGTFTIAVTPGSIAATNAATGASVTAAQFSGTGSATSGTVIVSAAGTSPVPPPSTGGDDTGTPGVPNTGVGDAALFLLAIAGLLALFGAAYISWELYELR